MKLTKAEKKARATKATARSQRRYEKAAMTLPPITLNAEDAAALLYMIERTKETKSDLIRRLIRIRRLEFQNMEDFVARTGALESLHEEMKYISR